ncbi:MAG: twin-arginine translocation signal domain-containing protein [Gemmatimonadota bacterium]
MGPPRGRREFVKLTAAAGAILALAGGQDSVPGQAARIPSRDRRRVRTTRKDRINRIPFSSRS